MEFKRRCQPSKSLLVRIRRLYTLHDDGDQTVELIQVFFT